MLRRDFIMVQIEELGKIIAQIVSQRNTDAARRNPAMIEGVYNSLKIDLEFLLNTTPNDIRLFLNGEDGEGLQRMDLAAKLLIEDAYLRSDKQQAIWKKSREILEYLQQHDATFSLERVSLLNLLSEKLKA